jgi:hypothetical protein
MHRTSAMAELFNVFRTRAAEYAWRPSPSPWPPSSPHGGEEGGTLGLERKNVGNLSRNGCTGMVRAQ